MRRFWYTIQDIAKGVVAISPLSIVQAVRRPRNVTAFHSDVLRAFLARADLRAPFVMPRELLDQKHPVNLRVGENGIFPYYEPQYLVIELVALLQPQAAFEIGTFRGLVTSLIAMNMPPDGCIYTLDLPNTDVPEHASDLGYIKRVDETVGSFFRDTPWMGTKIRQLRGNSLTFDFSPFYDRMELVLVDASHTYQAVFSDSMNAFRMIKAGGVILWHDYESMRSEYGVNRFVNRLRVRHRCPAVRLSSEWGDTRYAALKVTEENKATLMQLANCPQQF